MSKLKTKSLNCMILICVLSLQISCGGGGGSDSALGTGANSTQGKAGSMARFLVLDDYLYTISGKSQLELFNIRQPSMPAPWATVNVTWGIETLFADRGHLFIGALDGVYIYDNTDPANPVYMSRFSHVRSCDPVVVQGDYAYVTLRGGNTCRNAANQLDVINISDLRYPRLEKSYVMRNPKGLGVDGDKLFVCDDTAGLKIYDASDPLQLSVLEVKTNINCYDVIPDNNVLVVSDAWGILQMDYMNIPVTQLSEIPVE